MSDKNHKIQIFNGQKVRTAWNADEEKWYFSIVDVCGVLTDQPYYDHARNYWKVLKHRLIKEGNETVTNCNQLKMLANDGKMRLTDVADQQQLFRIIPFDFALGKRQIDSYGIRVHLKAC